ncbi:MAG: Rv2231c family pyridoxal phosphate-dependent protein CobC [Corynebacterium sp.]|nr:Rv2231c family pyridoxal phosphate-dependent protein CobC [Corynebacterium sp.]
MCLRIHGDLDARGADFNFAVNVHGTQPPDWLQAAIAHAIPNLATYPAAETACRELLADYHQIDPARILLTQGGAEGFALLPQLQPIQAVIAHPGFAEPDYVFANTDTPVFHWPLLPPFHIDASACARLPQAGAVDAVPQTYQRSKQPWFCQQQLLIIGNPTNPTGIVHHDLPRLVGPGRLLVVDEAFMDVASSNKPDEPGPAVASCIHFNNPRIIVLRSLTKTWAIAGLRIGYMVADPDIIEYLAARRPHWAFGTLQAAALQAIVQTGFPQLSEIQQQIAHDRRSMVHACQQAGFAVLTDSQAPFVLVRPFAHLEQSSDVAAYTEQVRQGLHARKIAIRRCDTFPGLDTSVWRLAVRSPDEVAQLLQAVQEVRAQIDQ